MGFSKNERISKLSIKMYANHAKNWLLLTVKVTNIWIFKDHESIRWEIINASYNRDQPRRKF